MKPEIYGKWKRPEKVLEVNSGELVTDTTGYVSPRKLIETYMEAGERLQAWRAQEYQIKPAIVDPNDLELEKNFQKAEDEIQLDFTRNKGYTQVEADEELRRVQQSVGNRVVEVDNKEVDASGEEPVQSADDGEVPKEAG